eukprot:sb/3471890/
MSDDLDKFLDNLDDFVADCAVEEKKNKITNSSRSSTQCVTEQDSEVDSILNDPDLTSPFRGSKSTPTITKNTLSGPYAKCASKCASLKIGPVSHKSCPNMRCSKCDCAIVVFDGYSWKSEVDYLFLRNNYPDFERVKSLLEKKKDARAFSCQCSHVSAVTVRPLPADLKWFCARY